MTHELDGQYRITSTSTYDGPVDRHSDGMTEIRNGQTERRDSDGVLWTSTFTVLNPEEVEMVSVADPSEARDGFFLTNPDGTPTRQPVTYTSVLKLARKGDAIQISGQVAYGDDIVFLTMRKAGD